MPRCLLNFPWFRCGTCLRAALNQGQLKIQLNSHKQVEEGQNNVVSDQVRISPFVIACGSLYKSVNKNEMPSPNNSQLFWLPETKVSLNSPFEYIIWTSAPWHNVSALKCGSYSRLVVNRVNTVDQKQCLVTHQWTAEQKSQTKCSGSKVLQCCFPGRDWQKYFNGRETAPIVWWSQHGRGWRCEGWLGEGVAHQSLCFQIEEGRRQTFWPTIKGKDWHEYILHLGVLDPSYCAWMIELL